MLFQNAKHPVEMKVTHLNKVKAQRKQQLQLQMVNDKGLTSLISRALTDLKKKENTKKTSKFGLFKNKVANKNCFVLDFYGDIKATEVQQLREEISTLLTVAQAEDEVIVRLESSGGMVHAYGLAAAQLARIKEAGLHLTVCIDKVAASGGYMMACVADKILAAPFAVVGSIGVVAQVPNFHDLLEKHDIDVEVFTAGKYKRTVTVFGENTEEDKQKFQQELEETHKLFKDFVRKYRPSLDVEQVATGEHWYGEDAITRNLVDALQTSDSYILEKMTDSELYAIQSRQKPTIAQKLGISQAAQAVVATAIDKLPDALAKLESAKMPMVKK
ncbi:putative protease SohB [Enhydrobacter sp. AX1]|nr:protease SohB [Enhydrobacter sp. AX1]VXB02455.1 putative protease SohB [Enhydrobacter sp. AX1]